MATFDPNDRRSWSRALGLGFADSFSSERESSELGKNSIMLDGRDASFWLSVIPEDTPIPWDTLRGWAWSSNVTHAVAIQGGVASAQRWDSDEETQKIRLRKDRDLIKVFGSLSRHSPNWDFSVIAKALRTFRAVRAAIETKDGSAVDVVIAFNAILALTAYQSPPRASVVLADALRLLPSPVAPISRQLRKYPIGDLARQLADTDGPYLVDADLLLRHASGTLFQEAHRELSESKRDRSKPLFPDELIPVAPERSRQDAPSFVHYTPPSLARILIEVAFSQWERPEGCDEVEILDPACGSGVFLIEAARELSHHVEHVALRGFDSSPVAVELSMNSISRSISESASVSIEPRDSLSGEGWGEPQLIVMNPPFLAWERLSHVQRAAVKSILGDFHAGRPDLSFAFIVRAALSLAPGGTVASIVPPSFLEGQSAELIRDYLFMLGEFRVRMISYVKDLGYFGDATVELAFIVISRSDEERPIRICSAESGHGNDALRALRILPWTRQQSTSGYDVFNVQARDLRRLGWSQRSWRDRAFIDTITTNTPTTVADIFIPRLGIRPGRKPVFVLSAGEFRALCSTARERQYFRPVADKIESGQIVTTGYVFYPYDKKGNLQLTSQKQVRDALPRYYDAKLAPEKDALKQRKSINRKQKGATRNWWELSEPVKTWLAPATPRIVSQAYGKRGNFAVDLKGEYAVVQGSGWCWKDGLVDDKTLLAYLAILNSSVFERTLKSYCPQVQGGQFHLYQYCVERVPLPAVDDKRLLLSLSAIGSRIADGRSVDAKRQDALTMRAYGVGDDGKPLAGPERDVARAERQFRLLAAEWEDGTRICSRWKDRVAHPVYQEVIALGKDVIPSLLTENLFHWSDALIAITGDNPVPKNAHSLDAVTEAWRRWAAEHGYGK